jgi:hypothetical protein
VVKIQAGRPGQPGLEIWVQPARLLFETAETGEHAGLILDGTHGAQTRLRFRVPFLPESLDGLLVSEAAP